jgi:hypothetical protein
MDKSRDATAIGFLKVVAVNTVFLLFPATSPKNNVVSAASQ